MLQRVQYQNAKKEDRDLNHWWSHLAHSFADKIFIFSK
jgi:hypothetical protein